MDRRELSLYAGSIVVESKLPKEAKLQMLNFIKEEASEVQLKALLLDGKIIPVVDEITEQVINDRFSLLEIQDKGKAKRLLSILGLAVPVVTGASLVGHHAIKLATAGKIRQPTAIKNIVAGAYTFAIPWVAYRGVRALFDKGTRKCGVLKVNTKARQRCMLEVKIASVKKLLQLTQAFSCNKTSNPKKCEEDKKKYSEKYKNKLLKYERALHMLKNQ